MFVFSFKASKIKAVCILIVCVIAFVSVISLLPNSISRDNVNKLNEADELLEINVKTEKGRQKFLSKLGYGVKNEPTSVSETTLPNELDSVTREYNKLQRRQGYDLSKYCGKKLTGYTYEITAFPDGTNFSAGDYVATIIVYKNKVVAADITNVTSKEYMPLVKAI